MIVSIKKYIWYDVQSSMQAVKQSTSSMQAFIENNEQAIKEAKALGYANEIKAKMKKACSGILKDSSPSLIVWGIFAFDATPYQDHVKSQCRKRNLSLTSECLQKWHDRYGDNLRQFLEDKKLSGKLGQYYFDLKKHESNCVMVTRSSIKVDHSSQRKSKVKLFVDSSRHDVEKDEVKLRDFAQEIAHPYIKIHTSDISKDVEDAVWAHYQQEFLAPQEHPLLDSFREILHQG